MTELRITEHERALRLLAVFYCRNQTQCFVDYLAGARSLAAWLMPESAELLPLDGTAAYVPNVSHWEICELCKIWKVNYGYCCSLLLWAEEEVAKHDPSNPQTSFAF